VPFSVLLKLPYCLTNIVLPSVAMIVLSLCTVCVTKIVQRLIYFERGFKLNNIVLSTVLCVTKVLHSPDLFAVTFNL
jgi:hypothetical protein